MKSIFKLLKKFNQPTLLGQPLADFTIALPRIIAGLLLAFDFGASKFGLPWSNGDEELRLFEVASWFPEDVAKFGFPFDRAPEFFAWMGAGSEAIGRILLALGLFTRFNAFLIALTMLVAIFFQKWGAGSWALLPALGFLWVAIQSLVLGSGRFGLDYLLSLRFRIFLRATLPKALLGLALGVLMVSCSSYANVSVPANEQFLLGELKQYSFKVKLTNKGKVEVYIKTIDSKSGEQRSGFGLPPGGTTTIYVPRDQTAVIENRSAEEALVRAKLFEAVKGMRYESLDLRIASDECGEL